ncbi:MAG: nucleotidyltransferase family protein [Actinomycetota bacterium]|nr:nucleotidyltransferase family protein [Actinomycetota bacterium]
MAETVGLLIAAGAGRRMGRPKALVTGTDDVPWVVSSARTLVAGGCSETVVVVGAAAEEVRALLVDEPVEVVEAADWEAGMGSSLRAGLESLAGSKADAALVHLVDLPDVGPDVVDRLIAHTEAGVLARASYGKGPGHPVLIGRDHWAGVAAEATGDRGARDYLARHSVIDVECSDLATGLDIDDVRSMLGK